MTAEQQPRANHPIRFFFIFCLLASSLVRAQDEGASYYTVIKVAPLRFMHFFEPGFEVAAERVWDGRWGVQASGGLIMQLRDVKTVESQFGYSASFEGRFYYEPLDLSFLLNPFGPAIGRASGGTNFIGLGVSYTQFTAECADYFNHQEVIDTFGTMSNTTYYDFFRLEKQLYLATLRFGKMYEVGNFNIEFSVGISGGYRMAWHSDRLHPEDEFENSETGLNLYQIPLDKGNYWTVRVPVQFRIGYVF